MTHTSRVADIFTDKRIWIPVGVIALVGLFYWFQIRPIRIYRYCNTQSSMDARKLLKSKEEVATPENKARYAPLLERNMYLRSDYESFLRKCLLYYGLPAFSLPTNPSPDAVPDTK